MYFTSFFLGLGEDFMANSEQEFLTNLLSTTADYLDDVGLDDEAVRDFYSVYRVHQEAHDRAELKATREAKYQAKLAKNGGVDPKAKDHKHKQTPKGKQGEAQAKSPVKSEGRTELTGAALEANKIISAILNNYKGVDKLTTANSIFADMLAVSQRILSMDYKDLAEEFFNDERSDHDDLVGALTTPTLYQTLLINRQAVHCKPRKIDDAVLLNTCDLFYKLPAWNIVLDLSNCPECGSLSGLMISRLSFKVCKNQDFDPQLTSLNSLDEDVFLDELALSFCYEGCWLTNSVGFTLDEDKSISDLVRELAYFMVSNEEDEPLSLAEREERLSEVDWDEAESVIDPNLKDSHFAMALYAAFKYLTAFLTHQNELKDDNGATAVLLNNTEQKFGNTAHLFLQELTERAKVEDFKSYYF